MAGGGWLAALAGYLFTYYNSKLQREREARIDRVNEQLKDFYGPLLSCVTATKSAYDAMVKQHSPDGTALGFQKEVNMKPDGVEARAYRLWFTEVLQPLNEKAASIIMERVDLLDQPSLIPMLLQLVAHVFTYRVILERWKGGEFTGHSIISYPDNLVDRVTTEFMRLKERQAELLGNKEGIMSKL